MRSLILAVALLISLLSTDGQTPAVLARIQTEVLAPTPPPESKVDPTVPHGEMLGGRINSRVYPGTVNGFQVYVPAQYDPAKPACLLVNLTAWAPTSQPCSTT